MFDRFALFADHMSFFVPDNDRRLLKISDAPYVILRLSSLHTMARPRAHSGAEGPKEPHSVSLKGTHCWNLS
jgi:hypothetical protein